MKNNIEESTEAVLVAKTRTTLVEKLVERVKSLHTYELPCIVSWKIDKGNPGFLQWIGENTLDE
jgi:periplasmic divalent cation tolerance protein